jgi:hypothetical protein
MNKKNLIVLVVVLVVVILALAVGVFWYYHTPQKSVPYQPSPSRTSAATQAGSSPQATTTRTATTTTMASGALVDTSGWKTYADPAGRFGFSYPTGWVASGPSSTPPPSSTNSSGTVSVIINLPSTAYPHTSFTGASFSVSTDNNLTASDCVNFQGIGGIKNDIMSASTAVIDGYTFHQFQERTAVTAKTQTIGMYYNGMVNDTCYGFAGVIGSSNVRISVGATDANYELINQQLNTIVSTVKFL